MAAAVEHFGPSGFVLGSGGASGLRSDDGSGRAVSCSRGGPEERSPHQIPAGELVVASPLRRPTAVRGTPTSRAWSVDRSGVSLRGGDAWLVAASRRRFGLPGLDPPRACPLGRDRRAIGVDSCRSAWAVRLGSAWPAYAAAGLVCSGLVEEAAPSTKSGVLLPRLRLCHIDTFSGVDGKPVESCTGVLGPALVIRAVAAAAGERFGDPALGWWFCGGRSGDSPSTSSSGGAGAGAEDLHGVVPRSTRHSGYASPFAVGLIFDSDSRSGNGVPSVQGLVVSGVFLCCSSRRRRQRSAAGVGSFCVKAPRGPDCTLFFFGGLCAFVLGHLWSLVVSRRCCVCAMFVTFAG
jgi:hypothetical protein